LARNEASLTSRQGPALPSLGSSNFSDLTFARALFAPGSMQALRLAARQAARATARGPVRCKGTVSEEQLFLEFGKAGRQAEPWEGVTYLTYTASFLVMTFGLAYAPRTSIKAWARDEAIARNNMEGTPEYGGQYAGSDGAHNFVKSAVGEMPVLVEAGGDGDDDDE